MSVVIPTYNRLNYLKQAVNSVKTQDYKEIELLVIDGGSDDCTPQYLESIKNEKTKIITRESPKGQSNARNKGIEASEGDYILFLDDDDRLRPEAVQEMVEVLEDLEEVYAGVYTGEYRFGDEEKVKSISQGKAEDSADLSFSTSCTMFKSEIFNHFKGFDESFRASEDLEFVIRLYSKGYYLFGIDKPLYERRIHEDQLTRNYEDVIRANRKILEIHEDSLSARERLQRHEKIGRLLIKLGLKEKAAKKTERYQNILERNSEQITVDQEITVYDRIFRLYNNIDRADNAYESTEKMEELLNHKKDEFSSEKNYLYRRKISDLYTEMGDSSRARSNLLQALDLLEIDEESFESAFLRYRRLGIKFIELGDSKNARSCFKASIKRNPADRFSYYFYLWSLFGQKGYNTGRKIERILKKN